MIYHVPIQETLALETEKAVWHSLNYKSNCYCMIYDDKFLIPCGSAGRLWTVVDLRFSYPLEVKVDNLGAIDLIYFSMYLCELCPFS